MQIGSLLAIRNSLRSGFRPVAWKDEELQRRGVTPRVDPHCDLGDLCWVEAATEKLTETTIIQRHTDPCFYPLEERQDGLVVGEGWFWSEENKPGRVESAPLDLARTL